MAAGRWSQRPFAIGAVVERNNSLASEPVGIPIELQLTLELVRDPADNCRSLGDWAAMELMSWPTVFSSLESRSKK